MTLASSRSSPKRAFRIATLVVPSALAWYVAFSAEHPGELTRAVSFALGPLWVLLAGALVLRTVHWALLGRRREATPLLAQLDVLTGSGSALAWSSAFAIMGAVWLGWASLAVVGLLGSGLFHVVVLLTFVSVRGGDPMRAASISRRFVPEIVTEGDAVIEELRFCGARIPIGFRLFATGRIGERWPSSRHVLDAAESGAEVLLESDIGPAFRGQYDAEPVDVWLQDTFGLCRSVRAQVGPARLTVLPRLRATERAAPLLDRGHGPRAPRPDARLPTEGSFRLRDYQQGDDVRRIHWVRSLAARELIVRLPDELPPDRPRMRVVLDTFFPEALALECDAPSELLDSAVGVWLAVGRALAESGARVTLVTAVRQGARVDHANEARGGRLAVARHELMLRAPDAALRLGAQVAWQNQVGVAELLTDQATFVVSRGVHALPSEHGKARWIVVVPVVTEPPCPSASGARLPYPVGATENRWSRRRREENRIAVARRDHAQTLIAMRADMARPPPGSFLALPTTDGKIRLEAVR